MAKKYLSGVRPTRIELLKLRKREILAKKGHDLLEEKRDAMITEFLQMTEEWQKGRRKVERGMQDAFEKLTIAQMATGFSTMVNASLSVPDCGEIDISSRHIMGVTVPIISAPEGLQKEGERGYSYSNTSATLDEAADRFKEVFMDILYIAEIESTLLRLSREIESTKRRVNALESILIPQLEATQKYIETHLEELEREDLFRRKRTKMILAQQEKARGG